MKKINKFGVILIKLLYSDRMAFMQIITGLICIVIGLWLDENPSYINITLGSILILMGIYQLITNKRKRQKGVQHRPEEA